MSSPVLSLASSTSSKLRYESDSKGVPENLLTLDSIALNRIHRSIVIVSSMLGEVTTRMYSNAPSLATLGPLLTFPVNPTDPAPIRGSHYT